VGNWPTEKTSRVDDRWYWAALALLDWHQHRQLLEAWFGATEEGLQWEHMLDEEAREDRETRFVEHVREFQEFPGGVREALDQTYHPNVRAIRALEKPVIAAINGACAGAGLSLACACDVRVASSEASFVPGFIGIGLVPDAGSTWFVHRLLGFSRAFEWMVSNRRLSAAEALVWGLVSEDVPAERFEKRVAELAEWYAERPTRAVAMTKQLFEHAFSASLEDQLELEAALQQAATETEDFTEGVQAFLEKRLPNFRGR